MYVMKSEKGVRFPVTGVIGSCEVSYLGAGGGIRSSGRAIKSSSLLDHLSSSGD